MERWFMAGSHPKDYDLGVDDSITYNGKQSAYIKSIVAQPEGFGTLMQNFMAGAYRNKRMRFSAVVKSENINGWAGLWMRVDGPRRNESLAFDNMQERAVKGTTGWQPYEIVLDVPGEATAIAFGILLHGSGQAWLSEVRFEEVDEAVLVTAAPIAKEYAAAPGNLDFSER
jgi:hypothetical protein